MSGENDKLKKMMEDASSSTNDTNVKATINSKVAPTKKKWPWIAGATAIVLIGGGIAISVPHLHNTQHLSNSTSSVSMNTDASSSDEDEISSETPVKLESWQKKSIGSQTNSKAQLTKFKKAVLDTANNDTQLYGATNSGLPSESSGTTSDTSKATLKDGSINPNYSYLTQENVSYIYTTYINRLLNPVFGEWAFAQYANDHAKSDNMLRLLNDMFSENWSENNLKNKDYSAYPIYADWNANDYGGIKFKKGDARWYGEVTKEKMVLNVKKDGTFKNYQVTDHVRYSAFTKDGKKITKNGVLKLTLIQNPDTENKDNRLLIDKSSLSIE